MTTPLLFPDLRAALACLYSLSPNDSVAAYNGMDSARAHDFLLNIQSRNVRRKLHAMQQSDRDQQKKPIRSTSEESNSNKLAGEVQGSTWLACLALLACAQADFAERLFAAQTLMHRLRRVKLSEAIDLDMEDPNKYLDQSSLKVNVVQLATDYVQWMHRLHPLLGSLVQQFLTEHPVSDVSDEEQLKGELTILTLAAITYLTVNHSHADATSIQPLLVTLGNAMASTALRLRFTPRSVSMSQGTGNNNKATPTSAPLVTMVVQSLSAAVAADTNNSTANSQSALFSCLCASLGVMPEALLSSGGGAMGRISIDPRCVQAAHEELRQPSTGVYLLWEALRQPEQHQEHDEFVRSNLLVTCEKWGKCLPLPQDFVDYTVPLVGQMLVSPSSDHSKAAALSYLIAIYESGSVTSLHILQFSLGISSDQLSGGVQPANKKRQSSRSRRRQQERLDTNATDDLRAQAEEECRHRGEMSCQATRHVWEGLAATVRQALVHSDSNGGEGPIGCLCACANACLPHWLRHSLSCSNADVSLALSIMELFQEICSHSDRSVRALAYEPLYSLNTAVLAAIQVRHNQSPPQPPSEMETIVANHLYQCTLRLATSCAYPKDYFDYLELDNDEEVEVERNDARDLIRAVCGCESDIARGDTSIPRDLSMVILGQIVGSVAQACDTGTALPPETAVHALSALAKPLNVLASAYTKGYRCEGMPEIFSLPIVALGNVHRCTSAAFGTAPLKEMFPVSRLANLATAAFAPALSSLCSPVASSSPVDQRLSSAACETVTTAVHAAALSIVHIPELAAESTLDHTQYDIRFAMRSPGGEDHVGCLALMRLAFESHELAITTMAANERSIGAKSLSLELCNLHSKLKLLEIERGPGVFHGQGVTPKSRRILCQTICHLVLLDKEDSRRREALAVLDDLFLSLITSIAELAASSSVNDAERMYRICEGVLDVAGFSSSMVCKVFTGDGDDSSLIRQRFLHGIVQTCQLGYSSDSLPNDAVFQWTRLRGALVGLLKESACPDIPEAAWDAIILLNEAECQAIVSQLVLVPSSDSSIFTDSAISNAGIFLHLVGEIIEQQQGDSGYLLAKNCVGALHAARTTVLEIILSEQPEPPSASFVDPRPTLCEAWFLSVCALVSSLGGAAQSALSDAATALLLSDSCCSALLLLLYQSLEIDQSRSAGVGMALDGPHTRAILAFLEKYFLLGPAMLRSVAIALRQRLDVDGASDDNASQGLAIVGACLFRAASGGLPPWAIEVIPSLYSSLFAACGNDPDVFCRMLELSMDIRLSKTSKHFGAVLPGDLLAGYYFVGAKAAAKSTFVGKSREACEENSANGWRRFKVQLKQMCGGKKKSSLSLKPSFTDWNVDRT